MIRMARGDHLKAVAAAMAVLAVLVLAGMKPAQAALPTEAFPDGHGPIAFEKDGDIWVASKMHLANLTPNTPRSNEKDPTVARSGREITFLSDRDGEFKTYVANVFTGEAKLVAGSAANDRAPSLSSGRGEITDAPSRSPEDEAAWAIRALKESDELP